MVVGGVVLILAGAGVGVGRARHVPWLRYAPVWYVVREAGLADPGRGGAGLDELLRRLDDGALSRSGTDRAVDGAVAAQADLARAWDRRWGDLVERARAGGRVSDARWRRYAAGSWPAAFRLDVRPAVHRGDPGPATLGAPNGRVGRRTTLGAEVDDLQLRWADHPAAPPSTRPAGPGPTYPFSLTPNQLFTLTLAAADMPAGVRVGTRDAAGHRVVLATGTLDLPGRFTLTDGPTVQVVHDPSLARAVRRSISIRQSRDHSVVTDVQVISGPADLAYAVLVRTPDGRETEIGQLAYVAVAGGSTDFGMSGRGAQPATRPAVLVLRPDPAVAAADPVATKVWDGELTFPLAPAATRPTTRPGPPRR